MGLLKTKTSCYYYATACISHVSAPSPPYAVLLLRPQKGCIWTGEGSGKGHKDDQRCGTASQAGITKQNRLETKWPSGDMTEVHKSPTCVTKGASWAQWEPCPLQAGTRGIAGREKVAGWKQGKGSGSSHNLLFSSGVLCLGMLWIPAVSKSNQTNSENKGLQGTPVFYRCNFQLRGGSSPRSPAGRRAHQASTTHFALSPVLVLPRHPQLTNIRERTLG